MDKWGDAIAAKLNATGKLAWDASADPKANKTTALMQAIGDKLSPDTDQAFIDTLNAKLSQYNIVVTGKSIAQPSKFSNEAAAIARSITGLSLSAQAVNFAPCLVSWSNTGLEASLTGINVQPEAFVVANRGAAIIPTAVNLQPGLLLINPVGFSVQPQAFQVRGGRGGGGGHKRRAGSAADAPPPSRSRPSSLRSPLWATTTSPVRRKEGGEGWRRSFFRCARPTPPTHPLSLPPSEGWNVAPDDIVVGPTGVAIGPGGKAVSPSGTAYAPVDIGRNGEDGGGARSARRRAKTRPPRSHPNPPPRPGRDALVRRRRGARRVEARKRGRRGETHADARPLLPSQPPVAGRRLLGADGAEHEVTIMEDPLDLSNEMPDDYR